MTFIPDDEGTPMLDDLLHVARRRLVWNGCPLVGDLRALESRLLPGERIEHHVRGRDADERLLWAATPRRLLLVEREALECEVRELTYEAVRHVERRAGRWGAALVLTTAWKTYTLDGAAEILADAFAAYVRTRLAIPWESVAGGAPRTPVAPRAGRTTELAHGEHFGKALRELAALRDDGVLTPEEYDAEKRKLRDRH